MTARAAGGGSTTAGEGSAGIAGGGGVPSASGGACTAAPVIAGAASVAGGGAGVDGPSLPGPNQRVAMSAPNAPNAAAAKIQAARGRSRTRMIVGSTTRPSAVLELTGTSELPARSSVAVVLATFASLPRAMLGRPGVPSGKADDEAAGRRMLLGVERRANAGGGLESRTPGTSAWLARLAAGLVDHRGTLVVRKNGGGLTDGSREDDGADGDDETSDEGSGGGAMVDGRFAAARTCEIESRDVSTAIDARH
jgi:hypothetical protein